MNSFVPRAVAVAAVTLVATGAFAAGEHGGGHGHGDNAAASGGHMSGGHMSGGHMSGVHGSAAMWGRPGNASAASRTVEVVMHDNYYEPETISVKAGETVRFKVRNAGQLVHEFNVGTPSMHEEHVDEMMMMMEHGVLMPDHIDEGAAQAMQSSMGHGMHNDPNSALLEPGETGEVVWTFPESGEVNLQFACNVPGHREAGMVGDFHMGPGS